MSPFAWLLLLLPAVGVLIPAGGRPLLRITAYCDHGLTASGARAGPGQCAAPSWVPFGSRIRVAGQVYTVTDRTARRFRHNTIDIWLPTRHQYLRHGVRWEQVWIWPKENHRARHRHLSALPLLQHRRTPHPRRLSQL